MKRLILLLFIIISFNLFSQDYPKIELNEKGEKVVVFTFDQAQQIDNDLDLLYLLKKYKFQCDTLTISYVKVIDAQSKQIFQLKQLSETLQRQLNEKDAQIVNQQQQIANYQKNISDCDAQKNNNQKEIDGLKKDVDKSLNKGRRQGGFVGFLVGVVVVFVTVILSK